IFLANGSEAIWQLQPSYTINYPYTTNEGNTFIPVDSTTSPDFYLTDQLLNSFEPGDKRKDRWIDSSNFAGVVYYYPYKYKVRLGAINAPPAEYTMILRLA